MDMFLLDAYSPQEIAKKVEGVGVKKARLPFLPMFVLAILAGALGTVVLVAGAGTADLMDHGVGDAFARIAMGKASLPFM
jgi:formate/nitrite transporter FocA (FNT family)